MYQETVQFSIDIQFGRPRIKNWTDEIKRNLQLMKDNKTKQMHTQRD
jgi:hypothetical protein